MKCPKCSANFKRRSKGCCPSCNEELVIKKGKVYRASDWGDSVEVLDYFLQELNSRRNGLDLGILWFPTGSRQYIAELSYARKLIERSVGYLTACKKREMYDPTQFAIFAIKEMFGERSSCEWLIKSANSINVCNGMLFSRAAPRVLNRLETSRRTIESNLRRTTNIRMDDMDVRYAI